MRSMEYLIDKDFIHTSQPDSLRIVIPGWVKTITRWWGTRSNH